MLLATALATPPAAGAQTPIDSTSFERRIEPFAVFDSTGTRVRFPFLGGLDRPRPQLADIDGDGDRDLFVQERAGRVMFFENSSGPPDAPLSKRLAFRSAKYRGLDVGQWFRFGDLDRDGDPDLLAEQPRSRIRYYRNDGTPAAPRFTLAADTLRTTDGAPIFADRRNRPALLQLGCSGPPDLFLGGVDGYLRYYRTEGFTDADVPQFTFVSDRYQDVCAGPPSVCNVGGAPGGSASSEALHGANGITAGDLDGDGDQDLLWGDFFSESFYRIERTGPCDAPALTLTSDTFPVGDPIMTSGFNVPDLADVGGDGDQDLVFGVLGGARGRSAIENLYLMEHTGDAFTLRTRRLLSMIDAGSESAPALADLDGDGDLDLALGNDQDSGTTGASLAYFEHTSSPDGGSALRQARDAANPFAGLPDDGFNFHPAFADVDGDGDFDLALGTFQGLALYENTGTPAAPAFDAADTLPLDAPVGNFFAPAFADLDGDGDPDLLAGESSGTLDFFRNTGTSEVPVFTLESESFAGIDAGQRAAPALRDADADGDLDLYVGTRAEGLRFYENTGGPQQPAFGGAGSPLPLRLPTLPAPAFADLDGDGDQDLLTGSQSGGLFYFERGRETEPRPPGRPVVRAAPNPFRSAATFRFVLAEGADVRLTLYDALGRRVAVLFEGRAEAGVEKRARLAAGALASGVYLFRLTAAGEILDTGTVVLVR